MSEHTLEPILVTGAHRSGTTWVGKMLAADAQIAYISEPLNVLHRPGVFRPRVKHWYQYICEENESDFLGGFQELLEFDYHLWDEIRSIRSRKDFLRMGRDFLIFYNGLMRGLRPLWKDPFAVFSTLWFVKALHCKVVITVRHPAAFASSLKRLGWTFDFQELLSQPLLMRDHLEPFRKEMESTRREDVIGQSALLWKLIYSVVHQARQTNPGLLVARHEDLSRDPVPGYRDLYGRLDLEFTPRVEKIIKSSSNSENPVELPRKQVHGVKMDSRASIGNWKKRLAQEEIERIRSITGQSAALYYPEAEW